MELVVNTDGASRGNPGEAAYGYVIRVRNGAILHQEGKKLGVNTNNFAEYSAIVGALEYIKGKYSGRDNLKVEVLCDSQLAVSQLQGLYKIKSPVLREMFNIIKQLEIELGGVQYTHVPREENFIADRLANLALDVNE